MTPRAAKVYEAAVLPAFVTNELDTQGPHVVFDSDSAIATACKHLQTAEVIVADLAGYVPDLMYALGLAHALNRCPLILTTERPEFLPFDLRALRCLHYTTTESGLRKLREEMTRAIRTFLASARAKPRPDDGEQPRSDVT
jgi:hypothetical protein